MKNKELKTKLWAISGIMEEMRQNGIEHNIPPHELMVVSAVTGVTYENLMDDDSEDSKILLRKLVNEVLEEGKNE